MSVRYECTFCIHQVVNVPIRKGQVYCNFRYRRNKITGFLKQVQGTTARISVIDYKAVFNTSFRFEIKKHLDPQKDKDQFVTITFKQEQTNSSSGGNGGGASERLGKLVIPVKVPEGLLPGERMEEWYIFEESKMNCRIQLSWGFTPILSPIDVPVKENMTMTNIGKLSHRSESPQLEAVTNVVPLKDSDTDSLQSISGTVNSNINTTSNAISNKDTAESLASKIKRSLRPSASKTSLFSSGNANAVGGGASNLDVPFPASSSIGHQASTTSISPVSLAKYRSKSSATLNDVDQFSNIFGTKDLGSHSSSIDQNGNHSNNKYANNNANFDEKNLKIVQDIFAMVFDQHSDFLHAGKQPVSRTSSHHVPTKSSPL